MGTGGKHVARDQIYRTVGRLDEAVDLYTRTLADRERVLGPNHPDTLGSRNHLAGASANSAVPTLAGLSPVD